MHFQQQALLLGADFVTSPILIARYSLIFQQQIFKQHFCCYLRHFSVTVDLCFKIDSQFQT